MEPSPVLIVGQGLSGSCLALSLLDRGTPVTVVDDGAPAAPSRVTPGLATPIAGPRLTFPPSGPGVAQASWDRYRTLTRRFSRPILHRHEILHVAGAPEEHRQLEKRLQEPEYARWLGRPFTPGDHDGLLADPWGGFGIRGALIDVPTLLAETASLLRREGAIRNEWLDPRALEPTGDGVRWAGEHFRAAVFCDGPAGTDNPWLSGVELQRVPGEVLTVEPSAPVPAHIYHGRAGYLAPQPGRAGFRLGATYGTPGTPAERTDAARAHLLEQLPRLLARPPRMTVTDHRAGSRPATPQRCPVVGRIPGTPISVLNGLGARAMLQAPALADALAGQLVSGDPLPEGCVAPAAPA